MNFLKELKNQLLIQIKMIGNMKKLLIFLIPFFGFSQITEIGDFKIVNGQIIWQKVYDKDLKIESQDLKLQAVGLKAFETPPYIRDISGAELVVEKKEGRTRLTVKKIFSISSYSLDFGGVEENVKPTYLEELMVKKKDASCRKQFIKKDGKLINDIIVREINALLPSNDNW